MKLNKLLFILFLININMCFAREVKKEYVLLYYYSAYSIDRQFDNRELSNPKIDTEYNKETDKKEPILYTREECTNKLREELLHNVAFVSEYNNDNYYRYLGGGLYQLDFGYYRYACAKYEDVKDYRNKKYDDYIDYDYLPKELIKKIPGIVDENNLQVFNNIFPLDKNEEESIKFTKKFDEKVKKEIKKGIIESKEEQRIEREEKMRKKEMREKEKINREREMREKDLEQ